jgi:hypothetical protein
MEFEVFCRWRTVMPFSSRFMLAFCLFGENSTREVFRNVQPEAKKISPSITHAIIARGVGEGNICGFRRTRRAIGS